MKLRQVGRLGFALFTTALMIASTPATTITLSTNRYAEFGPLGMVKPGAPVGPGDAAGYINTLLNTTPQSLNAGSNWSLNGQEYEIWDTSFYGVTVNYISGDNPYDDYLGEGFNQNVTGIPGSYFLLAKYDGGNGGSLLWYVHDGAVTLPPDAFNKNLSSWKAFTAPANVPDGGTTFALLGMGLAGLIAFGRKVKNR